MSDRGMPDHYLSEDSVTCSAEAFLRVADNTAKWIGEAKRVYQDQST